jgi:hypothetical protein
MYMSLTRLKCFYPRWTVRTMCEQEVFSLPYGEYWLFLLLYLSIFIQA